MNSPSFTIEPIGFVRSELTRLEDAPMQADKGAPEAWLELTSLTAPGLMGLAERDVLQVHPRGDQSRPLKGVFATRSSDRPNPVGLHRVLVLEVAEQRLCVTPLEAIDGTPIVDIKPVLVKSDPSER
jgi:tRNA (Thr-GGU) A37 N-methylase